MKAILKIWILLLVGVAIFLPNSSSALLICEYENKNGFIYYCGEKLNADVNTFEVIKPQGEYAKDKNSVFFGAKVIEDCDPETFELIPDSYYLAKDKEYVFLKETKLDSIEDSKTFSIIESRRNYTKDKYNVYHNFKKIGGGYHIDTASFELLDIPELGHGHPDSDYAKDKNSVFYRDNKINYNIDSNTFKVLSAHYSKDGNNIYFNDEHQSNSAKLESDYVYYEKKNTNTYNIESIKDVDVNSFEIMADISGRYSKDKKYVYLGAERLIGRDAPTFKLLSFNYSRDNSNVYRGVNMLKHCLNCNDDIMDGVDTESFEVLNNYYVKDKNWIYYDNRQDVFGKVVGADVDSFEVIKGFGEYSKDKNSYYYRGEKVNSDDVDQMERFQLMLKKSQEQDVASGKPDIEKKTKNNNLVYFSFALSGTLLIFSYLLRKKIK